MLEPGIRSGLFTQYMKMLDNGLITSLSMTAESILACAFETTGDRKPELPMLATCLLRLLEIEVVNAASSEFAHVLWSSAESGVWNLLCTEHLSACLALLSQFSSILYFILSFLPRYSHAILFS